MPVYVYRAAGGGCEHCRKGLEVLQGMDDEPLKRCPKCGAAIRRTPAPFSPGRPPLMSSSNLKEHGFKKLRRADHGGYVDDT